MYASRLARVARRIPLARRRVRWQHSVPSFPCVDAHQARSSRILNNLSSEQKNPSDSGPEPAYARPSPTSYKVFKSTTSLPLVYYPDNPLPAGYQLAYETWGTLSPNKDNVILLQTGLSASSHAASTSANPEPGWWEKFIGPGKALDTDKFFVVCANALGGCYGSTGPSSTSPDTGKPYATTFPVVSIFDMARSQFALLDELGVEKLYASVGSSMGGMTSLASALIEPERVERVVSISGTARSTPSSIAMRYAQRSVLMADPNWNNGFYYDGLPPHTGMKLARQIATITYRSGPEWEQRFGRNLRPNPDSSGSEPRTPALCPDFLIETYLDHQGESFCLKYDANSLIYISKAMDLFDCTAPVLKSLGMHPSEENIENETTPLSPSTSSHLTAPAPHVSQLAQGLIPLRNTPFLVLGVQSDILFTVDQQREMAEALKMTGNSNVRYYELGGVWGHDTFLLDVNGVGGVVRGFLSMS